MGIVRWLALMGCLVWTVSAHADPQCYSPDEMNAEQLLRLHSELMVITVTCHQGSQGEDLVPAYTGFTQMNLKELHAAEQTMIAYYHATYGGNGTERLDALRTRLGNEYGQKIAVMSAPMFCQMYRDKVLQMCTADTSSLRREVERIAADGKAEGKLCLPAHSDITKSGK